jgi:hypothetical protein
VCASACVHFSQIFGRWCGLLSEFVFYTQEFVQCGSCSECAGLSLELSDPRLECSKVLAVFSWWFLDHAYMVFDEICVWQ